jgi:vanillate O-demethylase monooxygenase subunit
VQVAALEDFCPHRGAPLSLGRVVEGKLVCGYHGLEMGCDGKTIAMPGQRVRGFPPIRSFPGGRAARLRLGLAGDPRPGRPGELIHRCTGPTTRSGPMAAGCTTSPATTA